ncbi:hypothetical protein CP532_5877 [Ophiocordyceps camponoti-leonardi (nom. inval.)]|nr:hypothetical protein CP532_5877 [Ophiocordyceps camponoti-leonardi (nom. inval.)]
MKDQATVVREFNELVNMTASELKKWLKSDDSQSAGWPKDGEKDDGESVGHDSGRKIIEILESNPEKDPESYSEDHIDHMRKVVAYCKRHLAQEEKTLSTKSTEEAKETKSYASLKNWGHDPLKKEKTDDKTNDDDDSKAEKDESDKQAGDKRKAPDSKDESNKKSKTEKEENGDDHKNGEKNGDAKEKDSKDGEEPDASKPKKDTKTNNDDKKEETNGHANGKGSSDEKNGQDKEANGKTENGPEPGDTVSWNWGNGQPEGKVEEVKAEKTSITTKNGNEATRKGDAEDPAVVIDTGKSKAIKQAHELN